MLRGSMNCTKTVLQALGYVTKRLHFFIFQLSKAEQEPLCTWQLVSQLAIKNQGGALKL
jgi:hypothetical protein